MQTAALSPPTVKVIGGNGQISLGKQFAGRQVLVEEQEAGVWLIRTASVIPDNERWVHEPDVAKRLSTAISYAESHPVKADNADALLEVLAHGKP